MQTQAYESVWDAIADSPEEAANLKLRSQLMDALEAYIARERITQKEAAKRFGVSRSQVSELVNGRISKFTIDKLVNMGARVGLSTRMTVGYERPSTAAASRKSSAAPSVTPSTLASSPTNAAGSKSARRTAACCGST